MYTRIAQSLKPQRHFPKRQYTTEPQSNGSNGLVLGGLLAATVVGGYMYTNNANVSQNDAERNPMVGEKVSSDPKKSPHESDFEANTNEGNKDTSRLVTKDTDKAKGVWEDKEKEDRSRQAVAASVSENNEGQSIWNTLFGSKENSHNPMVEEKRTLDKTKLPSENKLEAHANDVTHDTSNLVEKDTKKVEGVWNSRNSSKGEEKSFWSSLFGSSKDKSLNQARNKLNETQDDVTQSTERNARRLSGAWEDTKDAASAEAQQLKHNTDATWEQAKDKTESARNQAQSTLNNASSKASDIYGSAQEQTRSTLNNASSKAGDMYNAAQDQVQSTWNDVSSKADDAYSSAQEQGSRLSHNASDEYTQQKKNLNGLHQNISEKAGQWKNEADDTTKSWYEKGTEKIRNGLSKDNNQNKYDVKGHVLRGERFAEVEEGQLRPTRTQMYRVPANVIVEHARGSDM